MSIKLSLVHNSTDVEKERIGVNSTYLAYQSQYKLNDSYRVEVDQVPAYVVVQLDAAIRPALIYLATKQWEYKIPFNLQREWPYPDGAFQGRNHYATARLATTEEIATQTNLSFNSYDQHDESNAYPHASANAETRGEYVFYAKNAIDGIVANAHHGNYPFQSWGINAQADAYLQLDFGRKVNVNRIGIVLRGDYPHDSYWKQVSVYFSDGSKETFALQKIAEEQFFDITPRQIEWLRLDDLKKDEDSSTFPALTEIEVFGHNLAK
ncbi:discoidin domain-containing protein [Lapidilactobacillus bayanensis]|uniref:discoidin domain-containing protein n=1 Tax=Lapidilactobacillus bayanensis TaxID=2485998 RepID=UPI000F78E88B|nr:discoidin domain-containing protein [Lapidilactobacillus bayanensis]